jgi:hypothetical protein
MTDYPKASMPREGADVAHSDRGMCGYPDSENLAAPIRGDYTSNLEDGLALMRAFFDIRNVRIRNALITLLLALSSNANSIQTRDLSGN